MKNIILAILLLCGGIAHAQTVRRISLTTLIGTGFDTTEPSHTPFIGQIIGDYNFNERFSVGVGGGVSLYERPLIPVFAEAKVYICKPRKITPFLTCCAGYGFAVSDDANGGIYTNPAVGISCAVHKRLKLLVQAGYERQELERLKRYENDLIAAEFVEKLNHNMLSLKIGIAF